ncbi:pyridine nucleotide-disulfide oxidoreductase [candidate division KSB3 bacterium]|uniref:Pyridine nucleotide-disulfide oxidoreductase n=1 Tax=candidate division KSB3 bacterium TaxID=2044937 RepID=A0A9D5JT16_9BACT|nr:pyridine nucleotide-disulfide oxidoreductase [candidate division KSB3 bacterium]MBD3323481.1 pyridine nucleotide-disulfide oxidoreductase [candidate division KSB3 bacterium]
MGKHLVIVGAGHAHMTVLKNLRTFVDQGHRVTVISAGAFHYYSGMGPGMLSGIYRPEEIRFHVKKMAEDRGATFLEEKVATIDPEHKRLQTHSGQTIEYDVVSFNAGSVVPLPPALSDGAGLVTVKPIEELLKARQMISERIHKETLRITVVGGGAAGLEMTGNVWRLVHDLQGQATISLIAGSRLLSAFTEKARRLALASLQQRQIEVKEGVRLERVEHGMVELSDRTSFESDVVFLALGVKPSPIFAASGLPTGQDGGLLVNAYLQSVAYPEMFGGGDCITFQPRPLEKIGIYAVRENPILLHNLQAALNGTPQKTFEPQTAFMLLLNMGDGTAIFIRKSLVWHSKLAFQLKNYIDTTFMRKFQVSGERG